MLNKSIRRNVIPATACASGSTTTSKQEQERYASGIRFYITVAGGSTTGGIDSFFLCAVPPGGAVAIPLVGFSGASALSVNGTYMADFYPARGCRRCSLPAARCSVLPVSTFRRSGRCVW